MVPSRVVAVFLVFLVAAGQGSASGGRRSRTLAFFRKLLPEDTNHQPNRIGDSCSKDDVAVFQDPTFPLPNGIPTYTVQILNNCLSGCNLTAIHLRCGWFSSARLVDPRLFRRITFDDCLVNDGEPLPVGGSVKFQYANSFHYPLAVSSMTCVHN